MITKYHIYNETKSSLILGPNGHPMITNYDKFISDKDFLSDKMKKLYPDEDRSTWEIGDYVYCIQLRKTITIGKKYKIEAINRNYSICIVTDHKNTTWFRNYLFTKNPKHPVLIQNKFDL